MDVQNQRALPAVALFTSKAAGLRRSSESEAIRAALEKYEGEVLDTEAVWNEVEKRRRSHAGMISLARVRDWNRLTEHIRTTLGTVFLSARR